MNYSYQQSNSSNKLDLVSDGSGFTPKLGDFKDGGNWGSDYSYDANGNLKTDANKSISNITYNYLNLTEQISISGKGTIAYTYDAQGGKRSKTVTESGATIVYKGQNFYNVSIITTTFYINNWVYESKSYSDGTLQNALGYSTKAMFSGHEDGRIRPLYTNNTITSFAGDYFVKDHIGNIRMVLTDEQQVNYYPATTLEGTYSYGAPEANSMVNQEKQYYRIDPGYIVNKPWYNSYLDYQNHNNVPPSNPNPNYPAGVSPGQYATSQKVYSLNGSTNRTGLEMVIKVMEGDKIDIFGRSYHTNYSSVSNGNSTPLSILQIMSGLIASPSNAISGKGVSASQLESWNSGLVPSSFIRGQNYESGTTIPKAYINYIFLDEQFRYVGGGASRVGSYGEVKQHWSELSNLAAQKNGYLLVYVSNESNFTVFFDNLQVVHKPGPIVEETHYYPFGLTMSGISSKALNGAPENKRKWNKGSELQNKEFSDGSGLECYATLLRSLDPQLGRWWQIDTKPNIAQSLYASMGNNPILYNDPLGDTARIQFRTGFLGLGGKKQVDYNGGYLTNTDGSAYTGKVKGFLKQAVKGLDRLSLGGSAGKSLVNDIVTNKETVNIITGSSNSFTVNDKATGMTNVVRWDPSNTTGGPDGSLNQNRPGFIGFGHELAHAQDQITDGKIDYSTWYTTYGGVNIPKAEMYSTHVENMLRAENGINLRAFYSIGQNAAGTAIGEGPVIVPGNRTNANYPTINNLVFTIFGFFLLPYNY